MRREFGKKLIEQYIPKWDVTHVIDASNAYIPGHTTATVILFGRNRPPVGSCIRSVMGIRSELRPPQDPACGIVWKAILNQLDIPGSQSSLVSVDDISRERFYKHPWSLGGGGASQLKSLLDTKATRVLADLS